MVLHSVKGLLSYSSGALKASDNTYLIKSSNLNNQFIPSINIALNAIGKNTYGDYYSSFQVIFNTSSPQNMILTPGSLCGDDIVWMAEFRINGTKRCLNTYYYKYSSSVSYEKGNENGGWGNYTYYNVYKYNLIY
ncbi:hypothetical protein [Aliarcobacter butzleri]|uniref:hypothetical protein n=1 Tax=Aliarcobacter butzleri TaxID=28197 RepID=UPI00126A7782|nr:hypothetical protein [Aliarcobacter butzleri]